MTPVFSKLVFKTLVVILNYKKSNWFYFLCWHGLRSIKQLQCLSWQNTELFGKYIFRRSRPELFFENVATFGKHMCFFSVKLQAGSLQLCLKKPWHMFCAVNFAKFWGIPVLWNTSKLLLLSIARETSTWKKICLCPIYCSFVLVISEL